MPYGREDEYTGMEAEEWEILSQNMPNASDEEKSQAFQRYRKEKHFADREGEPFGVYDFLEGMGIETNENLSGPAHLYGNILQQGRQQHPGHFIKRGNEPRPEMMQEMPTSLMQQHPGHFIKRGNEPKPSPQELEAMKQGAGSILQSTMYGTMLGGRGPRGIRKPN